MLADPVGNATPNTADRSTFPGTGLICHFSAGATSEKPEFFELPTFAKYVGVSTRTSRQFVIDAVLDLQTARWSNNAGIRDIRPIVVNFVLDARTTVRLCRDYTVIDN